jgi:hypothetical protein
MSSRYPFDQWQKEPFDEVKQGGQWYTTKAGDSLASIAGRAGMTWDQLSDFNWGTSEPKDINVHLKEDLQCPPTRDGKNYYFRGGERLWVPKTKPIPSGHPVNRQAPGKDINNVIKNDVRVYLNVGAWGGGPKGPGRTDFAMVCGGEIALCSWMEAPDSSQQVRGPAAKRTPKRDFFKSKIGEFLDQAPAERSYILAGHRAPGGFEFVPKGELIIFLPDMHMQLFKGLPCDGFRDKSGENSLAGALAEFLEFAEGKANKIVQMGDMYEVWEAQVIFFDYWRSLHNSDKTEFSPSEALTGFLRQTPLKWNTIKQRGKKERHSDDDVSRGQARVICVRGRIKVTASSRVWWESGDAQASKTLGPGEEIRPVFDRIDDSLDQDNVITIEALEDDSKYEWGMGNSSLKDNLLKFLKKHGRSLDDVPMGAGGDPLEYRDSKWEGHRDQALDFWDNDTVEEAIRNRYDDKLKGYLEQFKEDAGSKFVRLRGNHDTNTPNEFLDECKKDRTLAQKDEWKSWPDRGPQAEWPSDDDLELDAGNGYYLQLGKNDTIWIEHGHASDPFNHNKGFFRPDNYPWATSIPDPLPLGGLPVVIKAVPGGWHGCAENVKWEFNGTSNWEDAKIMAAELGLEDFSLHRAKIVFDEKKDVRLIIMGHTHQPHLESYEHFLHHPWIPEAPFEVGDAIKSAVSDAADAIGEGVDTLKKKTGELVDTIKNVF